MRHLPHTLRHPAASCLVAGAVLFAAACTTAEQTPAGPAAETTSAHSPAATTTGKSAATTTGTHTTTRATGSTELSAETSTTLPPTTSDPEAAGEATTTVPSHSAPPPAGDGQPVHMGDPSGLALLKKAPEWIVGTWSSNGRTVTFTSEGSGTLSVDETGDGKTIDLAFQLNSVDGTREAGTAVAQIMSVGPRNTYRGLTLNSKVTFTFTGSVVTDSLTDSQRPRKQG